MFLNPQSPEKRRVGLIPAKYVILDMLFSRSVKIHWFQNIFFSYIFESPNIVPADRCYFVPIQQKKVYISSTFR